MAKPAKQAGRQQKEELRSLLRLAALKLQTPVHDCTTLREILLAAQAMHSGMAEQSQKTGVVLPAARSCGWPLAEPVTHVAGWAGLTHSSGHRRADKAGMLTDCHLAPRCSILYDAGIPILDDREWRAEASHIVPDLQLAPAEEDVCLADVQLFGNPADYQAALAA